MKEKLKNVAAFIQLISKEQKSVGAVILLGAFAKATIPFLGLFFSSRILNLIIEQSYDECGRNVACMLVSQLVLGLIAQACSQNMSLQKQRGEDGIKRRMAEKAYILEYEEYEKQETMDAIRRANNTGMSMGGVEHQIELIYGMAEQLFAALYAMAFLVLLFLQVDAQAGNFFTSYAATLVLLLLYVGLFGFSAKIADAIQQLQVKVQEDNDHVNAMYGYLCSTVEDEKNAKDMRIYRLQDYFGEKNEELIGVSGKLYLEFGKKMGIHMGKNSAINQLQAALAYIFVGAKAYYGVVGIGDVLLYVGAINRLVTALTEFVKKMAAFQMGQMYLKTYEEFLNRPDMSYDGTLPVEKRDDGRYEFEFHDVSFCYPDSEMPVLSHVNLKLDIGEKLAIVGQNGAGKTTLVKLLCRLYEPTEGYITLNGIDIRKYNYREYTSVFSVVFQDFCMFSMPLDENVAAGEKVDEERLAAVLDEVALSERVAEMKDGTKSRLYNNNGEGIDISGGEAQRLAIARALYKDGPFVILDEPTAALDPIAEAEIYENFNQMVDKKTAIYISHRMSSCKFCDKIVVLEQGRIAETGTHRELLAVQGIYAKLYETQAKYYA